MKLFIQHFAAIFVLFFLSSSPLHAAIITDTVTSRIINAPADQVWPYFEDFCNIYKVSPLAVSFCTTGVPNEPGLIRFIALFGQLPGGNSTTVLWEKHQLIAINSTTRTLELVLLATNRGVKYFSPVEKVLEKGFSSQLVWTYDADLGEAYTQEEFRSIITAVVGFTADGIENAIASSSLGMDGFVYAI